MEKTVMVPDGKAAARLEAAAAAVSGGVRAATSLAMRDFMCVLQWPVAVEAKPSGCAKPVHAIRVSEVPRRNIASHALRRCESGHIPPCGPGRRAPQVSRTRPAL